MNTIHGVTACRVVIGKKEQALQVTGPCTWRRMSEVDSLASALTPVMLRHQMTFSLVFTVQTRFFAFSV